MLLILCISSIIFSSSESSEISVNTSIQVVQAPNISVKPTELWDNKSNTYPNESSTSTPIKPSDFKPSVLLSTEYELESNERSRNNIYANNIFSDVPLHSNRVKFPDASIERPYTPSPNYLPTNPTYNQQSRPQEPIWKKIFGYEQKQKTYYEHETEPHYGLIEPPHHHHYQQQQQHYPVAPHYGGKISIFKKILKVLATVVPIGLFLSALTPTIITVSSVNGTINRNNRKDITEITEDTIKFDCEQKIFCELMVNAMFSKNAEDHVKNLLDNFVNRNGVKNEDRFIETLEAIKKQDCSAIKCTEK